MDKTCGKVPLYIKIYSQFLLSTHNPIKAQSYECIVPVWSSLGMLSLIQKPNAQTLKWYCFGTLELVSRSFGQRLSSVTPACLILTTDGAGHEDVKKVPSPLHHRSSFPGLQRAQTESAKYLASTVKWLCRRKAEDVKTIIVASIQDVCWQLQ